MEFGLKNEFNVPVEHRTEVIVLSVISPSVQLAYYLCFVTQIHWIHCKPIVRFYRISPTPF